MLNSICSPIAGIHKLDVEAASAIDARSFKAAVQVGVGDTVFCAVYCA
jgi:hypothetical protein